MTIPRARLAMLFLQSRRAVPIALSMAGVAAAAVLGLETSNSAGITHALRMAIPLAMAVVIGVGVESPFGEAERTASLTLPSVRFGHLALLLALCGPLLTLASVASGDGEAGLMLRNSAGFIGLALLGARILGPGTFWVVPLGYAGAVLTDFLVKPDRDASWRWPLQPNGDAGSWLITGGFLAAGLGLVVWYGSRDGTEPTA